MSYRLSILFAILSSIVLIVSAVLLSPRNIDAAGSAADLMCIGCQMDPSKPRYCPTVFCSDSTNGFSTSGMCAAPGVCLAKSTNGGGLTDIASLLQGISKLMEAMKGGGGGSGGGSGSGTGSTGCTTYTQVSTPSADPCAYYVPNGSSTIPFDLGTGGTGTNSVNDLLNALNGTGGTNTNTNTNTNTSSSTATATVTNVTGSIVPGSANPTTVTLGNISLVPGSLSNITADQKAALIAALQAKLAVILQQIAVLVAQQNASQPSQPAVDTGKHRACSVIARNLAKNAEGDDVRALQEFLKVRGFLSAEATGFFGALTEAGVNAWQASEGLTPAGTFGPLSLDRLRSWCSGGDPRFSVTPNSGPVPLSVTFKALVGGFNPYRYAIDFGDGSAPYEVRCSEDPQKPDACFAPASVIHTYNTAGIFTTFLGQFAQNGSIGDANREIISKEVIRAGVGACSQEYAPICASRQVTCVTTPCNPVLATYSNRCMMNSDKATYLYEGTCRIASDANKYPTISGLIGPSAIGVNERGSWTIQATDPENVALSYAINWGDGTATTTVVSTANASYLQTAIATHAYAAAGTYILSVLAADTLGLTAKTVTTVKVGNAGGACTTNYEPVCGRAPGCANTCPTGQACPAICQLYPAQNFTNRCQLDAAGAQFLSNGQCTPGQ